MAYWDTSGLLKLYASEADSLSFRAHVLSSGTLVTSKIARLELLAAFLRKEATGGINGGDAHTAMATFDSDVTAGLISVCELDSNVVARFETIVDNCHHRSPPLLLRTLDAIHLATAVVSGETEVVTGDKRLRDAALLVGLSVFPRP